MNNRKYLKPIPLHFIKNIFTRKRHWLLASILLLHVTASFYYISFQNITYDEPQYIEYAKRWLHGHPERIESLDDSKSPVVAICWVPRIIRQVINPNYKLTDYGRKDQAEGRYMMILFSLLAAWYVYKWCRELYGGNVWIFPLVLLLFDPLFLAYSTLITTDLACGTFLVALLFHYRKYLVHSSRKDFYLAALFTGIAIVTKQSLLFVFVLLPLLSVLYFVLLKRVNQLVSRKALIDGVLFSLIILLVINIAYYFYGTGKPFGDYVFESQSLQGLQQSLSFLHWVPVPFPSPYIQSIDMLQAHAALGPNTPESTYPGVYLFGELHSKGFWYYYLVVSWCKMPLGTIALLLSCIPIFLTSFRKIAFAEKYLFLILPIVFYWFILSFINQFQTGIRHLLIIYPLLFIGMGYLFFWVKQKKFGFKITAGILGAYSLITTAIYFPFIIPYTNEMIGDKKNVHSKMLDTSIDYGQSDFSVNIFLQENPGYVKPTSSPASGKFVIPMRNVFNNPSRGNHDYDWLRRYNPKRLYRNVILIYEINEQDLKE